MKEEGTNFYWTELIYSDDSPYKDLHCTHKFLGSINDSQFLKMIEILSDFFKYNDIYEFAIPFNEVDFFGRNKDIIVMRDLLLQPVLPSLKMKLDTIVDDQFIPRIPHIIMGDHRPMQVYDFFVAYQLKSKRDGVLAVFPFKKYNH